MTDRRTSRHEHDADAREGARSPARAADRLRVRSEVTESNGRRRARMLRELHGAMDRTARGRRAVRWSAGGALVLACATAAGLLISTARAPQAETVTDRTPVRTGPALPVTRSGDTGRPPDAGPRVVMVGTDPSIAERLGRGLPAPRLTLISDDELVALASADGLARGLVRCGAEVRLILNQDEAEVRQE